MDGVCAASVLGYGVGNIAPERRCTICQFVSWVEKGEKVYFLNAEQVLGDSVRAKALRDHTASRHDYVPPGHGAIRWYYDIPRDEGDDRECEVFCYPSQFPAQIVRAIKSGDMRGLGEPVGLLTAMAWKAYLEVKAMAWKAYQEATAPAEKAYLEVKAMAEKAYQEVTAMAWKAYKEATAPAEKAYLEVKAMAFWDLFAKPENRAEAWR